MKIIDQIKNPSSSVSDFINKLMEASIVGHKIHLQAKTKSYAEHMAMGEFYSAMPDFVDTYIESYQGKYGIVTDYGNFNIKNTDDATTYVTSVVKFVETYRKSLTDGWLQQICDDIIEKCYSVLYKLKNLH